MIINHDLFIHTGSIFCEFLIFNLALKIINTNITVRYLKNYCMFLNLHSIFQLISYQNEHKLEGRLTINIYTHVKPSE